MANDVLTNGDRLVTILDELEGGRESRFRNRQADGDFKRARAVFANNPIEAEKVRGGRGFFTSAVPVPPHRPSQSQYFQMSPIEVAVGVGGNGPAWRKAVMAA